MSNVTTLRNRINQIAKGMFRIHNAVRLYKCFLYIIFLMIRRVQDLCLSDLDLCLNLDLCLKGHICDLNNLFFLLAIGKLCGKYYLDRSKKKGELKAD